MRKRTTKISPAAAFLSSPAPSRRAKAATAKSPALSPAESPAMKFDFDLDGFNDIAKSAKLKNNKIGCAAAPASKLVKTTGFSTTPQRSLKSASSISDLKDMASSDLDSIKHRLERSHAEIWKDIEASECRLQKRFKIQTQSCQQVMDEAEKEFKKISDRINEGREAMKDSYAEFIAEAQATASRFCKTSIPELSQNFEKGIASLRSRYGISSTKAS